MKSDSRLQLFVGIIFAVSVLITIFMLISSVLFVTAEAIPPFIFFLILTALFVLLDMYYLRCLRYIKDKESVSDKQAKKLKITSVVLAAIFAFNAFVMLLVVSVTALFVFFEFQLYFLFVAILFSAYTICTALMHNKFGR